MLLIFNNTILLEGILIIYFVLWVLLCLKYIFIHFSGWYWLCALLNFIVFKYLISILISEILFLWKNLLISKIYYLLIKSALVLIIYSVLAMFLIIESLWNWILLILNVWIVLRLRLLYSTRIELKLIFKRQWVHLLIL